MKHRIWLALVPWMFCATAATAQDHCVVAGRVNAEANWAPRFKGVELLSADGKRVSGAGAEALASVKQARVTQPALLSACNGNRAAAKGGDSSPSAKTEVPAVSPGKGLLTVAAVSLVPLEKAGGSLVELKLTELPTGRVVMVKR